jgi:hypothetical protein
VETEGYKFLQAETPPEHRRVTVSFSISLATYHRIAEVMQRHKCGLSDALEAMLQNVEAIKVAPIDRKWKNKYSVKKKPLFETFDLYRKLNIRKK